jgi:tetratricopeptide (TPR) repeat protein
MDSAKEALSSFLPKMIRLAPDSPKAAALAAQGLRLESLLSAHQLRIHEMVPLCQQSVEYARNANDPDVLSAALNGLAVAYKYTQQLEASFKTYQEALFCSDQASPLLRTRVYAGAAAAFAQRGRLKEADFYIHLAYDDFPEEPEHDPNFLTADNGLYMVAYYEGLIYLQRGMPKQAIEAFERYKTLLRGKPIPERNRLEIVNHQGRAAILSGNQEYYAQLLEEGITGALALGSKKRYDEAVQIFHQETPRTWWRDRRLQQVIERFSLPLGER